ncbi:DNA-binding response regulator [Bradyrhizobium sp. SSBR45G]|uniref:response regulator n=1 Tax=unclassified Bradyrhizobium TaxID=2631580 RepID=UPI00234295A6|nr:MULTISPECIES: response regulator transcription factor [unclassified Bradyrhizobium]GLH80667.1 DNA-binding response regulator [Bradyrhizobium sp. SSBR45G]GLH88056.1 DNA-binding response regulator [Bradyrhizobium sp. SSBR45R]
MARLLIVEDHPLFREALESAIHVALPGAEMVEAASIDMAVCRLSSPPRFDLILLDLSTPGTTGLSGVIRIRKTAPRTPILVVSAYQDPQLVAHVLTLGVAGYISKSTSKEQLADAISAVLRGEVHVQGGAISPATRRARLPAHDLLKRLHELTPQQLRVLDLIRCGLQNKQIAYELGICETTVKVHVSEILRKLRVMSRTKAIIEMEKIDFVNLIGEPRAPAAGTETVMTAGTTTGREAPLA